MLYLKDPIEKEKRISSMVKTSPICAIKVIPEGIERCLFAELVSSRYSSETGLPRGWYYSEGCESHEIYINLALFSNCEWRQAYSGTIKQVAFSKDIREKILESYKSVTGERVFRASDIPNKENLESFMIPEGYDAIEEGAFSGCPKMERVLLPKGMKQIGNNAFSFCPKLQQIEMPKTVEYIGGEAFSGCTNLTTINVTKSKGKNVDDEVHLPDKLKFLGVGAFADCKKMSSIEIPSQITEILANTFNGCSGLTNVQLLDSLQNIEDLAFIQCSSLKEIKIPNSVKKIGHYCFAGCSSLEHIQLSSECSILPKGCFDGCESLKKIEIPPCVKTIQEHCLVDVSPLLEIVIQQGNKEDINIHSEAFPEETPIKELNPRVNPVVAVGGNIYETIESPKEPPFAGLRRLLARHKIRQEGKGAK